MLLLIITNLLFIPLYGIVGAALASFISKLTYNLFKYIFLWRKLNFQAFSWKTLLLIGLGALTLVFNHYIPTLSNNLLDILVRSSLITLFFGIGVILLKLSEDVNQWLTKIAGLLWRK
jgi:O-antigen/teichoic acid export membrane protein